MRKFTERLSFTVPAERKAKMKAEARERGISLSALVRKRIDEYLGFERLLDAAAELSQSWSDSERPVTTLR